MATEEQKRKAAAQTGLYLAVVAAIVVVANILSAGAYERIDMTKTEQHTLSKGSARLVHTLKEPIEVDAYVKTGLAQLDAFVRDLRDLLEEYERVSGGKFDYTIIEANTDELREKAREAGLQEQPFGEASATGDSQASITQGFMGLVFKYGSEKAVIPALHPARSEGLEFFITNKIREIRDKNDDIKHRIGVISGKDELGLSDNNLVPRQGQQGSPSVQQILTQNFPFYSIEPVDLKGGETAIDTELEGLVITQPGKEYTDKELRRIDQFMMSGDKSLVVIASAVNIDQGDTQMNATLDLHGLNTLTEGYGIKIHQNAVFDHGAQFRVPVMTGMGGMAWIRHPGIAHVVNDPRFSEEEQLLDPSFPGFFRMEELMMPFPSSLELLPSKQPEGVTLEVVARTTPATSVVEGETVDMSLREQWEPKPPFDQRSIAAVAKGPLKSAFADNVSEEIDAPKQAQGSSRLLVIASSQFITNPFAYAGNGPEMTGQMAQFGAMGGDETLQMIAQPYAQKYLTSTILAMKNILDWMSGDADLIAASAKILGEPNLTYSSIAKPEFTVEESEEQIRKKDEEYRQARKTLQTRIQWTLTFGLPGIFVLLGIWRWRRRENRRAEPSAKPRRAPASAAA